VLSVYAGDDFKLGQRLSLTAAVRVDDHHDSFGVVANPRLALVAQPYEGGNTKLMFGTAYRAPSFYERYFQNGASELPGNRCLASGACVALQPETIRTGEFEHVHSIGESGSLLIAGYWSRIANILRLAGAGGGKFAFGNRSTLTHSSGIEAEARWQPEPGALLAVWYSFAHVTNDNGFIVPNVPTHTAALRALWPVARELFSASTELIYGSSRYTPFVDNNNLETPVGEQLFWNVGFTGTLGRSGPRFQLLVQNVLDSKPQLPAGLEVPFTPRAVPQTGRTFRATISSAF
jgi:iron complex outermembrane receptor protein